MNEELEIIIRAVFIGIGATVILDLWAMFLKYFFEIPSLSYRMVGRWSGHILYGRFMHNNITNSVPVRGELIIGWGIHYIIGIIFGLLLLNILGLEWARHPTFFSALIFGIFTVVAPFLVMQPGMGLGIAASKTPTPNIVRLRSIVAHTVFGIGLYITALLMALLIRQ